MATPSTTQLLEATLPDLLGLEAGAGVSGQPTSLTQLPPAYSLSMQEAHVSGRLSTLEALAGVSGGALPGPTDSEESALSLLRLRLAALVGLGVPPTQAARRQTVGVFDVTDPNNVFMVAQPVVDEPYTSGKIKWDGLDIRGNATDPSRKYQARPLSNAADLTVPGTWKGVLANNSDSFTGAGVWGSDRPTCFNFRNGRGRYGPGYIERSPNYSWFEVAKPGARVLNPNHKSSFHSVDAICSDAEHTYRSGVAFSLIYNPETGKFNTGNFVTATNNSDESDYTFTAGESFHTEGESPSALDVSGEVFPAIGIAVQQAGRLLLHLHPDRVVFFDKRAAGPALGQVALSNPAGIAMPDDTTVAIVHDGKVELFTLDPVALTLTSIRPVPVPAGFVPREIAFSPVDPQLSVVCGGLEATLTSTAKHRIFHFNTNNYDAPPRVDGSGNLGLDPLVTDDTFCFYDAVKFTPGNAWLAYQEDGSYWFDDEGNKRSQHRAADGTLLYTRYCAGTTYNPTADITNPSRVFNDYLEYEVDHSKPKRPDNTNGWWKLKYNRACFRQAQYDTGERGTFMTTVEGRTLSMQKYGFDRQILCEWRTTAPALRFFPEVDVNSIGALDTNGDLLEAEGFYAGETKINYRRVLTGFVSADGPPTYAARVEECRAPLTADTANSTGMFCGPTTDGTYGCYALAMEAHFHLAGMKRGATSFRFETAESTWTNYMGPWPVKGQYDVGNGVWAQGNMLQTIDNYFIWGCRAERWKNGQVVKFMITTSDGRYVGQFGTVRDGAFMALLEPATAGQGGNALTFRVAKIGSKYVLMHGDENAHGGVHIWEFDLSTVREEPAYAITATAPEVLPGYDVMGTIPFDKLQISSGTTIGNWATSGNMYTDTSRLSRTSLLFYMADGARAAAPFPAGSQAAGYTFAGLYAWLTLGGLSQFLYPIAGLELKDTNGNIFLRLAHLDDGNGNTINTANGVVLTQGVALVAAQETAELRPFRLRVTQDGKQFFSYNGRPEVALPAFSGIKPGTNNEAYTAGNPLLPGTVEVNLTAYANGNLFFGVDQLRLLSTT